MFIEYGIDQDGGLIRIDQVLRGKTELACPYCGGGLTAKKGRIVIAHFAHTGETCYAVNRDQAAISLPAYDNFNLHLPGRAIEELRQFSLKNYGKYSEDYLERFGLIKENEWIGRNGGYEITRKGKLVLGQLSLMLFNEFQEPLILERHQELEQTVAKLHAWLPFEAELEALRKRRAEQDAEPLNRQNQPHRDADWRRILELSGIEPSRKELALGFDTALVDLHLYRAQWRRILGLTLYFLSINDGQLYKIGVTTRDIAARIEELKVDLLPHYPNATIDVLGTWPHRGNVELYFKHRYQNAQVTLGELTEYYRFDDAKAVLRDLRRMKAKTLIDLEAALLAGKPSDFEQHIQRAAAEQYRRRMIRRGMAQAGQRGQHVGRPPAHRIETFSYPNLSSQRCRRLWHGDCRSAKRLRSLGSVSIPSAKSSTP